MDLIELAKEKGLEPKKTSSTEGGEYHCACPNCGGNDRFALWPNAKAGKCQGRYWCRQCDAKGDTIQFCRDYLGFEWEEACARLNVTLDEFQNNFTRIVKRPEKVHKIVKEPCLLWQQKAALFVAWSHERLLKTQKAMDALYIRGFTDKSIKEFKLGYHPVDAWREYPEWGLEPELKENGKYRQLWLPQGWVLPWFDAKGKILKVKVRWEKYESELEKYNKEISEGKEPKRVPQKYIFIKGGMDSPVTYGDQSLKVGVLLESEFDGLLIQQFAGDLCFSIATGGSRQPIDFATDHLIRQAPLILLCPDDDEGGDFLVTLQDDYRNMKLWPAPIGKSPGDALKEHGINLREWIMQGIPKALRNQPGEL